MTVDAGACALLYAIRMCKYVIRVSLRTVEDHIKLFYAFKATFRGRNAVPTVIVVNILISYCFYTELYLFLNLNCIKYPVGFILAQHFTIHYEDGGNHVVYVLYDRKPKPIPSS